MDEDFQEIDEINQGNQGGPVPPRDLLRKFIQSRQAGIFMVVVTPDRNGFVTLGGYDPLNLDGPKSFEEFLADEFEDAIKLLRRLVSARTSVENAFKKD